MFLPSFLDPPLTRRPWRLALASASWLVYAAAFGMARPTLGPDVIVLSAVPVLITAGLLGFWPGVLAGALAIPLNSYLVAAPGETVMDMLVRYRVGHAIGLITGGLVGWLSDLLRGYQAQSRALAGEIAERQRAETALREFQATLEERVAQRTQALQESEARYRQIYESNRVVQLLVDPQTLEIVDGNAAAADFYGYDRASLAGMAIAQINRLSVDEIRTRMAAALSQAHTTHHFRHQLASGEVRLVEVYASPMMVSGRRLMHVLVRDTTEQARYEAILQRYRLLSEHARDIILFVRAADGRVLEANTAAVDAYGYTEAELLGLSIHALRDHDTQSLIPGQLQQASAAGTLFETVHRRKDGSQFPVEVSSRGLDLDGERVLLSIVRDISARQQAEAALRESERRFQLFMHHFPGLAYIKDAQTRVVFANQGFETYLDLRPADILGKANGEIFSADFAEPLTATDRRVLDTGRSEVVEETYGGHAWATYKFAIPQVGQPHLMGGLTLDISARKQAETALRESEHRFRTLAEAAFEGIALSHDGVFVDLNDRLAQMLGYERAELVGRPVVDCVAPEHRALVTEAIRSGQTAVYEHLARRRDGQAIPVESQARSALVGDKLLRITAIRDITQRKRAEEALRLRVAQVETIINNAPLILYSLGRDGVFTFSDGQALAGMGLRSGELVGQSAFDVYHDRPDLLGFIRRALAGEIFTVQAAIGGRTYDIHHHPLLGEQGQNLGVIGILVDVTDRQQTEQALRENEYFLTRSQEVGDLGSYYLDARTGNWISSPKLDAIFGIDADFPKTVAGWLALIRPDHRAELGHYLRQHVLAEHNRFDREYCIVRQSDGQERWVHGLGELEFDTTGQPLKMIGTIQDITERKRTEQALRESEAQLRLFYELPFIGMAITSPKTKRWVRVNERLAEILGYPRATLMQKTWAEMTHPDDLDLDVAEFERVLSGASDGYRLDKRFVRPDGGLVYATIDVRCVRAADGSVDFFVATVQDIGDRKRIEAELERRVAERTAQLEVANRELEAFAYSVSHDLRAPLRAIDGFSQALLEDYGGQLDAPGQDYLRRVRQGAQQMGQLIDALLMLSRVTRQELSRQPVDLSALAGRVAQDLQAGESGRTVAVTVQPGLVVSGDPRLLGVLVTNLLGNAWKFTRRQPAAQIEFGLALIQGERVYFVRDNGVGFNSQYAAKLFQPFQRLHGSSEFEGTGIGLATVQRVVQRHGGRVWAEGSVGAGAAFYFRLPD